MPTLSGIWRALPFVASRWLERHPVVQRLGRFLPLAIMVLPVVHTVVGAQWFQKNALLSMRLGTGVYVVLLNGALF